MSSSNRHSAEELARAYGRHERMLFGTGGYFAATAEAAYHLGGGLVVPGRTLGTYRRGCLYITDEESVIAAALAARPDRSPVVEPSLGNRLRR